MARDCRKGIRIVKSPSYVHLHERGILETRIRESLDILKNCRLCPRQCGIDRIAGNRGFCRTGRKVRVASAAPHFGEEKPLVGRSGSGTIFVSSCNLLCSFCQNPDISHLNAGSEIGPKEFAQLMISLAQKGCHNINFVTPIHVVPQILEALPLAIERGLRVPLVYNTSAYDSIDTLRLLEGIFDIYMPDFKFWDGRWSDVFCCAPDYPEIARAAVKEMHRQVGDLVIDGRGIAERGLILRHLVMPGGVAGTSGIMSFLAHHISRDTYVNIMGQYHPSYAAVSDGKIGRRVLDEEYKHALAAAKTAGMTRLDTRTVSP